MDFAMDPTLANENLNAGKDRLHLPWLQSPDKVKSPRDPPALSHQYGELVSNILGVPAVDKPEPGDETSGASIQDSQ
jgi:hypothetical protein